MNLEEALELIKTLKNENEELKKASADKDKEIKTLNEKYNKLLKEYEKLKEKKQILAAAKFISKNEKINNIIDEADEIINEKKENKKRGPKNGSKNFSTIDFESLVEETRYEESTETICPKCGEVLVQANEHLRYLVEVVPSKIKVVKVIRKDKKCPKCNKVDNQIYYKLNSDLTNGGILTPSFLAYILYHKYELGIPFTHLSKHISSTLKMPISKQLLASYTEVGANIIDDIFIQMKTDLLNSQCKVIHADETTLVVSKDKEKEDKRLKNYVYVYTSSFYEKNQIYIYSFQPTRKIDDTINIFKDFHGVIECDDYSGYTSLAKKLPNIKLQRCMAHARRRFADILKSLPKYKRKNTKAYEILTIFENIFKLERKYKLEKKNPIEIANARKNDQLKEKDKLYRLIFEEKYSANSAIEAAVNYVKNVWNDLWTYIDDGYVDPSNNVAERAVKPFVIQRKNFQTAGSYNGAIITTKIFSLIQTARANGIDVEKYLTYIFENYRNISVTDLMPYSENIIKKFKQI